MLLLRILTLPIAMAVFAGLYTMAVKAPAAVELGSLLMWSALAIALLAKATRRIFQLATGN